MSPPPAIVVLCGVSGSGKTTLGRRLAEQLGWPFVDADDLQPAVNIVKMRAGQPLTDSDREPWLSRLTALLLAARQQNSGLILACSALKFAYRQRLRAAAPDAQFVLLTITPATARLRVRSRPDHFAGEALVESQFSTLEPLQASEGLTLNGENPVESLLSDIHFELRRMDRR